jgi:regulatory protein
MGLHRINGPIEPTPKKQGKPARLPRTPGNPGAAPVREPIVSDVETRPFEEETTEGGKRTRKPKLLELPHDEQVDRAKNTILNILSMVAKTRSQLEQRLTEKGHSPEVIEEAINRMIEVGVIDDAAFARNYTSSLHDGRGLARRAISRDLNQKGIDQETIEKALEGLDADAEYSRAVDLVRKKARSTANLDPQARVRRLVGMLARKGYPGNVAFSVVKEVLAEESPEIKDMENPD